MSRSKGKEWGGERKRRRNCLGVRKRIWWKGREGARSRKNSQEKQGLGGKKDAGREGVVAVYAYIIKSI